jgi:nitrogen-specific signal transduction histidine kinase
MGLDIVQAILVRNNGSIEVSSTPGRTEFRVRLPIAENPQQVKA